MVERDNPDACLDYCFEFDNEQCVGVDVDYTLNPVRCWPHTDLADYDPSNLYTQDGTNSYQLITICATGTSVAPTGTGQSVHSD